MDAIGINLGYLLFQLTLCSTVYVVPILFAVRHLFAREDLPTNTRNIWLLVIAFAPILGVILYFLFGRNST